MQGVLHRTRLTVLLFVFDDCGRRLRAKQSKFVYRIRIRTASTRPGRPSTCESAVLHHPKFSFEQLIRRTESRTCRSIKSSSYIASPVEDADSYSMASTTQHTTAGSCRRCGLRMWVTGSRDAYTRSARYWMLTTPRRGGKQNSERSKSG
ncbi:hypothetical protein FIBSPDRAFT_875791 [Athelia psychrophila]|uniref:Uncharacterized protein n=1 Tax=Athelia psychrophila TaxID=1759441 RepID=A0A167XGM2_9AGAM|nr:hypothetical protein FIBSPDRAFT_875791 [Fibularhizoctonia sp. CBS 109695]